MQNKKKNNQVKNSSSTKRYKEFRNGEEEKPRTIESERDTYTNTHTDRRWIIYLFVSEMIEKEKGEI